MKIIQPFEHGPIQAFRFGFRRVGIPRFCSHLYFVDGLLIDTGHMRMRRDILNTIQDWPVEQIYTTHHHEDHTGNLAEVSAWFNRPIQGPALTANIMHAPPWISPAQWWSWGPSPKYADIEPNDTEVKTENYRFDVVHTPGHAIDMVCLHEANQGWLFTADLYVYHQIAYFMANESMKSQIESIRKVLALEFEWMFCGHNPKFKVEKEKLARKLAFFESFYAHTSDLHHQGLSAEAILSAMGRKERWGVRALSLGNLSMHNMVKSVIRDETESQSKAQFTLENE